MTDTLWVAVGFLIFIGVVVYAGGFKALLSGIDARAEKISAELNEAKRLRDEAQALLASYEAKKVRPRRTPPRSSRPPRARPSASRPKPRRSSTISSPAAPSRRS
jgi:hypothetical protein